MRNFILILLFVGLNMTGAAATENIVVSGRLQTGTMPGQPWQVRPDCLSGGGVGNRVASRHVFAANDFTVKATLRLNSLSGTAAALVCGDNIFGFDGDADHKVLFFESEHQPMVKLGPAAVHIRPGEWFEATVAASDGKVSFAINGKIIYTAPWTATQDLGIYLRPHRNLMAIREFSVTGTPRGEYRISYEELNDLKLLTPLYREPVGIEKDQELTLTPNGHLAPGKFRVELYPVAGTVTSPVAAEVDVTSGPSPDLVRVMLPASLLKTVWEASSGGCNARPVRMIFTASGRERYESRMLLYNPQVPVDFPQCRVEKRGGVPTYVINGEPLGTITSVDSTDFNTKQYRAQTVRDFAAAGIRGNLLWVNPGNFSRNGKVDEAAFLRHLYEALTRIVCDNPNSVVDLHWQLFAPPEWSSLYPDEMIKLDNGVKTLANAPGKKLQPSYASELWRTETTKCLQSLLTKLRKSPFADRIAVIRLCYANCGEWNHWGYHEKAFVDFSMPMQRAFGQWLKQKYRTEDALRQAWGRPDAAFDAGDLVPERPARMAETGLLRHGRDAQPVVDYDQFFQLYTVETIEYFAKTVKQSSDSHLLVGAYYGYYLGHYGFCPYHFQDSGSYALQRYLASPYLDFLGGPYPYDLRRINNEVNGITASVALHGKVFESENDMRTHRCGPEEKVYGATDSLAESIAIAKRDFMLNLQRKASYYFFDFLKEWYRDPEFMATVAALKKIDRFTLSAGRQSRAQTAFILSEEVIPYLSNNPQPAMQLLHDTILGFNNRLGTGIDYYLESDLGRIDFTPYKAVVFANAYAVSAQTLRLTKEKVCRSGRSVLFLYAPGVIGPEGNLDPARSRDFTGIGLRLDPAGEFTRINSIGVAAYLLSLKPIRLQTFIDDAAATPIAAYPDGRIAGAMKKFATHTATVLCYPAPNAAWLRTWLKKQGVHIYQDGFTDYDSYYFAGPLLGIYSRTGGDRSFTLRNRVEIVADLFSGEILAKNTDKFKFSLPAKTPATRIFYAGTLSGYQEYRRLK